MNSQIYPEPYEDLDEELFYYDELDGDCPGCHVGNLFERRDVDKYGESFILLYCKECGYEEQ